MDIKLSWKWTNIKTTKHLKDCCPRTREVDYIVATYLHAASLLSFCNSSQH